MKRFVEGVDRDQSTLFPDRLDDWIIEDNPVRVIDDFVNELDLGGLGFGRVEPQAAGRPGYHPSVLLKLNIYGYLNRVHSSHRLERGGRARLPPQKTPTVWCRVDAFPLTGSRKIQKFKLRDGYLAGDYLGEG